MGFGYGYPYYYGYYGYPYYYGGYYGSPYGYYRPYGYYAPYRSYAPYSYGYAPPASYGEGGSYESAGAGALALKVKPKTAQVYVDGRYVGSAGSYDGFPGYLWLPAGSHRVELVQDGFANLDRELEVAAGHVTEFKLELEPGPSSQPRSPAAGDYEGSRERAPYPDNGDYRSPPPRGGSRIDPRADQRRDLAGIVLDVRPDDASVYVDGRFVGTGREVSTATEPLRIEPGEHRVQVVHPDFGNEERSVTVEAGEEKLVEVTLHRGDGV